MSRRLADKRCIVTGGTRGLGLAIALEMTRQGAKVAITYARNQADADRARQALEAAGAAPLVFRGSVADAAHVNATIAELTTAWGGIDVLVNNAGHNQVLPIALVEEADWDNMLAINCKGAYLYSRAVLKSMIRARRGHILSIGSFVSERIVEAPVHYAAAKAALRGFTEALAREVGRYDIKVNLLSPGLLNAGLSRMLPKHRLLEYESQCALGRLGTVDEVARFAAFLVSDDNSLMTGAKLLVDGGL